MKEKYVTSTNIVLMHGQNRRDLAKYINNEYDISIFIKRIPERIFYIGHVI